MVNRLCVWLLKQLTWMNRNKVRIHVNECLHIEHRTYHWLISYKVIVVSSASIEYIRKSMNPTRYPELIQKMSNTHNTSQHTTQHHQFAPADGTRDDSQVWFTIRPLYQQREFVQIELEGGEFMLANGLVVSDSKARGTPEGPNSQ